MARKKSGLDMSPEARAERTQAKREEMEKQGCPFGRYPNGAPRTRPEVPLEMRSYYVAYGMRKDGNQRMFLCMGKSRAGIENSLQAVSGLIRDNYSAIEIVRCKRVSFEKVL